MGNTINYENKRSWSDIIKQSSKVVSLFDLAGHEKYLRTTILGLSSGCLDLVLIAVGANMGVTRMTKEHIFLCLALNVPFAFVMTKIDIVEDRKNVLDETINDLKKISKMPGIRKALVKVKTYEDVLLAIKNTSVIPMFFLSNITLEGFDNLKFFLNQIPKNRFYDYRANENVEYHIDTVFSVHGVGTVVGGHLKSGHVKINDTLY